MKASRETFVPPIIIREAQDAETAPNLERRRHRPAGRGVFG
jgi:hypothetical protein